MKASIIIPTFNEERVIAKTIRNAKQQRAPFPYEIILVDGGSNDQTKKIAKAFGVSVLVAPRRGKVYQLNYAAKQAQGEIFCFLDADTLLPENYLTRICRFFDRHNNVLACGARHKYENGRVWRWRLGSHTFTITSYEPLNWMMTLWYLMRDLFNFTELPGCNMCVRRNAFFAVKGFRPVKKGLGVDAVFSFELRRLATSKGGKRLRYLLSPSVLTAARHLSLKRSSKRLKQIHRYVTSQKTTS